MSHFSQVQMVDIEGQHSEAWESILKNKIKLPSPHIRLYDKDGNFLGTRSFLATDDVSEQELTNNISDMATHTPQTSQVLVNHSITTSNDKAQLNNKERVAASKNCLRLKSNHPPLKPLSLLGDTQGIGDQWTATVLQKLTLRCIMNPLRLKKQPHARRYVVSLVSTCVLLHEMLVNKDLRQQ